MRSKALQVSLATVMMAATFLAYYHGQYSWAVLFAYLSGNFVGRLNSQLERS